MKITSLLSKTMLVVVCGLIWATALPAQNTWFDIGLNFAYGPTFQLNKNIGDSRSYEHQFTMGKSYGAKIGVNFGQFSGLHVVYNLAEGKQDYELIDVLQQDQTLNYTWNTHDIMLLYRYSGYGAYVEFGPKYSIIRDVTQTIGGAGTTDVTVGFTDYTSAVLGFGSYIAGSDVVTLNLGIRLAYSFTDMISEEGMALRLPETTLVEGFSQYESTNPISAMLNVELSYAFGRIAKRSCQDRKKLILF